jgi:peptide/nickel transport system substrate-binding protein
MTEKTETPGFGPSRRSVLAGAGAATLALAAGPALAQAAREAPDLAEAARAGRLPPLAQRIPSSPLVVRPHERVGRYGGTLRRGLRGSADHNGILRMVGNQGLVRWNLEFTDVLPNVAERWTVSADSTEFTFHLRPGMKWSDGQPFTSADVVFSIEEVIKNRELYRSVPTAYQIGGKACDCTAPNETTVVFKFAEPYGLFLVQLATPLGQHATLFPRHYASRFMPKFNPQIADVLRQANQTDWTQLFRMRLGDIEIPARWGNAEKPTIDPWVVEEPYTGGTTRMTMHRNPFFWQVDMEGNQLPYIDRINFSIAQDVEGLMLEVISGRIDIQERHIEALANKPVAARNAQRGNYRLFETINSSSQAMMIYPNLTHKDPALRQIFNTKEVRQALSLAINRPEVIEIVYLGQSEPWQTGPRPGHPWANQRLSKQFTEFDVARANALLDGAGFQRRNAQGVRLRPDGQPLFFTIDTITALYPDHADVLELVKRYWAAVGVDLKINTIERALFFTRGENNDHDMAVWGGPGGLDPLLDARDYVAVHPHQRYGIPWSTWYASNGREGMEPPESQKRRMALFDQAKSTANVGRQGELVAEILNLSADAFECFGVALAPNLFGIASNRLSNVPERMPNSWSWPHPGPALPQQFFFTS